MSTLMNPIFSTGIRDLMLIGIDMMWIPADTQDRSKAIKLFEQTQEKVAELIKMELRNPAFLESLTELNLLSNRMPDHIKRIKGDENIKAVCTDLFKCIQKISRAQSKFDKENPNVSLSSVMSNTSKDNLPDSKLESFQMNSNYFKPINQNQNEVDKKHTQSIASPLDFSRKSASFSMSSHLSGLTEEISSRMAALLLSDNVSNQTSSSLTGISIDDSESFLLDSGKLIPTGTQYSDNTQLSDQTSSRLTGRSIDDSVQFLLDSGKLIPTGTQYSDNTQLSEATDEEIESAIDMVDSTPPLLLEAAEIVARIWKYSEQAQTLNGKFTNGILSLICSGETELAERVLLKVRPSKDTHDLLQQVREANRLKKHASQPVVSSVSNKGTLSASVVPLLNLSSPLENALKEMKLELASYRESLQMCENPDVQQEGQKKLEQFCTSIINSSSFSLGSLQSSLHHSDSSSTVSSFASTPKDSAQSTLASSSCSVLSSSSASTSSVSASLFSHNVFAQFDLSKFTMSNVSKN